MAGDWVWDGTVLVAWWPEASRVGLAANHGPMTSLLSISMHLDPGLTQQTGRQ
jgi:hypothetical protein